MSPSKNSPYGLLVRHFEERGLAMGHNPVWMKDMPPLMGFPEEQYIEPTRVRGIDWSGFYTAIVNGKRVYVWAYRMGSAHDGNGTCVMVSDSVDPAYGAQPAEILGMYVEQHTRQKQRNISRTHRVLAEEPIALQAFIYEVTRGGNENMELMK